MRASRIVPDPAGRIDCAWTRNVRRLVGGLGLMLDRDIFHDGRFRSVRTLNKEEKWHWI